MLTTPPMLSDTLLSSGESDSWVSRLSSTAVRMYFLKA